MATEMKRATGIGPVSQAWRACIRALNDAREYAILRSASARNRMVDRLRIELSAPILQGSAAPQRPAQKIDKRDERMAHLLSRPDRLKPARPKFGRKGGFEPTRL